jgi:hypothetical protein
MLDEKKPASLEPASLEALRVPAHSSSADSAEETGNQSIESNTPTFNPDLTNNHEFHEPGVTGDSGNLQREFRSLPQSTAASQTSQTVVAELPDRPTADAVSLEANESRVSKEQVDSDEANRSAANYDTRRSNISANMTSGNAPVRKTGESGLDSPTQQDSQKSFRVSKQWLKRQSELGSRKMAENKAITKAMMRHSW